MTTSARLLLQSGVDTEPLADLLLGDLPAPSGRHGTAGTVRVPAASAARWLARFDAGEAARAVTLLDADRLPEVILHGEQRLTVLRVAVARGAEQQQQAAWLAALEANPAMLADLADLRGRVPRKVVAASPTLLLDAGVGCGDLREAVRLLALHHREVSDTGRQAVDRWLADHVDEVGHAVLRRLEPVAGWLSAATLERLAGDGHSRTFRTVAAGWVTHGPGDPADRVTLLSGLPGPYPPAGLAVELHAAAGDPDHPLHDLATPPRIASAVSQAVDRCSPDEAVDVLRSLSRILYATRLGRIPARPADAAVAVAIDRAIVQLGRDVDLGHPLSAGAGIWLRGLPQVMDRTAVGTVLSDHPDPAVAAAGRLLLASEAQLACGELDDHLDQLVALDAGWWTARQLLAVPEGGAGRAGAVVDRLADLLKGDDVRVALDDDTVDRLVALARAVPDRGELIVTLVAAWGSASDDDVAARQRRVITALLDACSPDQRARLLRNRHVAVLADPVRLEAQPPDAVAGLLSAFSSRRDLPDHDRLVETGLQLLATCTDEQAASLAPTVDRYGQAGHPLTDAVVRRLPTSHLLSTNRSYRVERVALDLGRRVLDESPAAVATLLDLLPGWSATFGELLAAVVELADIETVA